MNVHHFNKVGCKIHHMSITVLEKVKTNNTVPYRLARKAFYIEKFNLKYRTEGSTEMQTIHFSPFTLCLFVMYIC